MSKKDIFISIASFRDTELVPTINNLIENCSDPKRLKFNIFMQFGDELRPFELIQKTQKRGATLNVKCVPHQESKGVCWARHHLLSLYNGEDFYLQLDSHHRASKSWDLECIKMVDDLKDIGYNPTLSAYLPSYSPFDESRVDEAWRLSVDRFTPEGCLFFIPDTMPNFKKRKLPMRSRFASGHFIFSEGDICSIPFYNPDYFFHGEEIFASCSLERHNKQLFAPSKPLLWHEYSRNYRGNKKVWDTMPDWVERNNKCHSINRQYFHIDPRGDYDFTPYEKNAKFSIQDYEKFAGIHFKSRSVHPDTLLCKEPPILYNYKNYSQFIKACIPVRRHCLDVWNGDLPDLDNLEFVAVIYESNGTQLFREEFNGLKLKSVFQEKKIKKEEFFKFWSEFRMKDSERYIMPTNAVVWPYLKDGGWGRKLDFDLRN